MSPLRRLLAWAQGAAGVRLEVRGRSMEPSFPPGTRVIARRARRLQRGDVVVLRSPADAGRLELKRVIGLPRDTIAWTTGAIWINHQPCVDPHPNASLPLPGDEDVRRLQLDACHYFVAGDNRLYSRDSRGYGPVPRRAILGIVCKARR